MGVNRKRFILGAAAAALSGQAADVKSRTKDPAIGLEIEKALVRKALDMTKAAYAPYSHFQVGAAVLASSGKIYGGANVENASYGAAVCAERTAIFNAVVAGERKLVALAVAGGKNGQVVDYCAPCGICRQVMREFGDPKKFRILIAKSVTDYRAFTLAELLPESFGPENLGL